MLNDQEKRARKAERMKRYYALDPPRWREVRAAKYVAKREIELARSKAYRETNRALLQSYERQRYRKKKELIAARVKAWRAQNPGHRARWNENRRARKLKVPGVLSRGIVSWLFERQQGRCAACSCEGIKLQLDHIIPLSRGGPNDDSNVQLLCRACNAEKSNKMPHEFRLGRDI